MPEPTPPPPGDAYVPAPPPAGGVDWRRIEAAPEFRALVAAKRRFMIPATVFFIAYYFALPVLVGYFPGVMERDVVGEINLAYLFALSQFVMAWGLMALYIRRARAFDAMEHAIVARYAPGGAS
ncbi:MAG TPA: DUF485 domain-containing protein [Longimicrobiaceae bacterium]|nr:DUF485 domain-containing protein [Longimicrobiaceae bacterium]